MKKKLAGDVDYDGLEESEETVELHVLSIDLEEKIRSKYAVLGGSRLLILRRSSLIIHISNGSLRNI